MVALLNAKLGAMDDQAYVSETTRLQDNLESLELAEGPFSIQLYQTLLDLAQLEASEGDFDAAIESLRKAQNILHREEGVYTPRQHEIIEKLTNIYLSNGEYSDADEQQKFSFFVTSRHWGDDDDNTLEAYRKLANWYLFTGQPQRARKVLQQARDIAITLGQSSLPYALAADKTRRFEGVCCRSSDLIKVLSNSSDVDNDTKVHAYLTIADNHVIAGKTRDALKYFSLAASLSPIQGNAVPKAISTKRYLAKPIVPDIQVYRIQKENTLQKDRLERITHREQLEDINESPSWFIFDAENEHYPFQTSDLHEQSLHRNKIHTLTGQPLVFSEDQLINIMPLSLRSASARSLLKIELTFAVKETGRLENISIVESNAPIKLNRFLVDALKKSYYRPGLTNGIPVYTESVTLTQTFPVDVSVIEDDQ